MTQPAENTDRVGEATGLGRARSSSALAAVRVLRIFLFSVYALSAWSVARLYFRRRGEEVTAGMRWTQWWVAGLADILGVEVSTKGEEPPGGVLLAPNHIGYMDVLALGTVVPCHFVAKAEVQSWPFVGRLFNISGQIGVVRKRSKGLREVNRSIAERLEMGDRIVVFLEGTSTGGDHVMRFYPSLVQPAIDAGASIVPVGIRWHANDPRIAIEEDVAYWKDHVFGAHVWRLAGLRGIKAEVIFGAAKPAAGLDRKDLADSLRAEVVDLTGLPGRDSRF